MIAEHPVQRETMRGRFITFEGGEGTGKSTQITHLADALREQGIDVVVTREPGGSPGAEILRHVILSGAAAPLGSLTEAMLFAAARNDHLECKIRPALARGSWVLCDRFADSTRVYQGAAGHVEPSLIDALERITVGDTKPDLTLVLDVPAEMGLERAAKRRGRDKADRFEAEDLQFHETLRAAFRRLAERESARCALIDARDAEDAVAKRIWSIVQLRLLRKDSGRSDAANNSSDASAGAKSGSNTEMKAASGATAVAKKQAS
ncbi:MAG TPA: dTMP kinase [Xanthobacteraceae bacterium]|jgi:dTMP kinase|nr:dTMP kinase [Xanthobacteraceae bacterium]